MDEFSVIVEGIGNKVKRFILRNKQLKDRLLQLEQDKLALKEKIGRQEERIQQLESTISDLQVSQVLGSGDTSHARQKLNDLLREIEKCQSLLNR
jgi:predicted  nucleic acid-binding Zn-ribbon protein